VSLLLALAVATAAQAGAPQPRGLSLREAQTLPAPVVTERVLGAMAALYTEVSRPAPEIRRGRGFTIAFATTPRSGGYPGICYAETITVHFGPAADSPPTVMAGVQSVYRGQVYRMVSEVAPPAHGRSDGCWRALEAECAASGPVLPQPGAVPYFHASYDRIGGFSAAHVYFGALVLAKATSLAESGTLPTIACRDDPFRPEDRICDDPSRLLRNLPMERFTGFTIDRCAPTGQILCVTARFLRGGAGGLFIEMRTGLSEALYPPPDIAVDGIRIYASTPIP
jgi:hypothetical protein